MLVYSPNAGFANEDNMIMGTYLWSDPDQDISQGVVEISDPKGMLVIRTEPTPIMGSGSGVTGSANFTLNLDKALVTQVGLYHFTIWAVDLAAHESNHLEGTVRMASRSPYDNMNNP